MDTGAKFIGIAVTSENKVLAKGEIELRDGISDSVSSRAILRSSRRSRKTRYRKARFLNRKRKDGWIPPSVQSKLNATFTWIDKFINIVSHPILNIEVGKFDIAKIINPDVEGEDYQNGNTKGYFDVRYFVFARDNYTCQVCKRKNKILNTHHVLYKDFGGTDRADNLITVCTDCHTSENHKEGGILYKWMIQKKKVRQYKEPTFMNIVRKRICRKYSNIKITYGSITTPKRKELGLDKTHYNDAISISGINNIKINSLEYFYYKQFRKKKRSLHEQTARKIKSGNSTQKRNNKNVKFRNGIHLNDKVLFNGIQCWVDGFAGGEKSKECVLRNINGKMIQDPNRSKNTLTVDNKNFKIVNHNNGWQYMVLQEEQENFQNATDI